MTENMQDKFLNFVRKRENIRILREEKGVPEPWTDDPILQKYRFCNIRREDDKVTRWIRKNLPMQHYESPLDFLIKMAVARRLNLIRSLQDIKYELNLDRGWNAKMFNVCNVLMDRKSKGFKIINSAYMVVPPGDSRPLPIWLREVYIPEMRIFLIRNMKYDYWIRLSNIHDILIQCRGVSDFMSGQILADCKNDISHPLYTAKDGEFFVVPGPGSIRGLNRFLYRDVNDRWLASKRNRHMFCIHIEMIAKKLRDLVDIKLDYQDVQNCLCEFDKYCRAEENPRGLRRFS